MAGAGFKTFNTGDVLTAADVNTYLMQQTVMVFANASARTTALSGVLAEGMLSYLADTNATEVYDGSAWVSVSGTGDITAVTTGANSGLAGGVTTGNADIKINFASKGQLAVGTGSGTTDFLNVGTNGHTLVADSSTSTGLKWAAPAGGGKVLQVVNATYNVSTSSSSSTFADTGLSATITPTSNTSQVLVIVTQAGCGKSAGNVANRLTLRLVRGATNLVYFEDVGGYTGTLVANNFGSCSLSYLDSPATTSATTYKTQFANENNTAAVYVNDTYSSTYKSASSITLMEIGA